MLLERPAFLRDARQRRRVILRRLLAEERPARGELADARDAHHVVAESVEVVAQPLGQNRHLRPGVHRQEEHAQPGGHLAFAMQRDEGSYMRH